MDDTLGFNEQEKKSDDWIFGDTEDSAISVSSTSRIFQQNHDLQVISKKEIQSDRPTVHATKWELLAYYRGYATGPTKTQFLCMQQENFKTYLWFYLSNVFCKTLTSTYVYVFLSVYAPDSHFFISKMLPIAYVYFESGFKRYPSYGGELIDLLQVTDIDLLSESTTAPPVIHVLSSRSIREIKPIQDSSIIVTSNVIFNIFRGFVSYLMKMYCDNMVKASLQESVYSPFSLFYLWPIYFSQFYLGDLFGILFFGLNFVNEYLIIVITMQCLIEAILNEWRSLKPYMVISFLILVGIIVFMFIYRALLSYLCFFCIAVATLIEVLIIFYMYPMGRLVDDLTFFSGIRPTKLRVITFWITPVFYTIKIYIMMKGYFRVMNRTRLDNEYPFIYHLIYFLATPMVLGALYAIYKYVFKFKMGFSQLFKPLPSWGPRDFLARRLRKQYDSRVYIGSRAPRELSRYLFEKADLNAYKLDIRYDATSRRSTQRGEVYFEREKDL
ncbi:uncharacterized protein LOC119829862 [Zerene cesonia]|uniref:uncharacterized protein LOC119829862 n=1 Tax=Zerene cesonia TaxID=33412 RepID=UPI0018E56EE7|nr:uncharacterized protein LOC119829862 [Zerene cesonia]